MSNKYRLYISALLLFCCMKRAAAQSMHFSQYYNSPLLLNPANTALTPDLDYRIGANYRNQWAVLPVPYNTMSAFGDLKVGGKGESDRNNWLGLGAGIFNDKAGNGGLSLLQLQMSAAYHLHLSKKSMLSLGLSGAYCQRSVNYDNLTFDAQWDGFTFNSHLPNGEKVGVLKTNYTTIAAGFNYAYIPNEAVYIKLGAGVTNINQPTETFYNSANQVHIRPTVNLDMLFRTSETFILNPSVYYTTQTGASELIFGSLSRINMTSPNDPRPSELLIGLYDRWGDAVIGVLGYQYGGLQMTASYDFTMSTLAPYNGAYGAMEFSLIYGGSYYKNKGLKKMYSCPRFN